MTLFSAASDVYLSLSLSLSLSFLSLCLCFFFRGVGRRDLSSKKVGRDQNHGTRENDACACCDCRRRCIDCFIDASSLYPATLMFQNDGGSSRLIGSGIYSIIDWTHMDSSIALTRRHSTGSLTLFRDRNNNASFNGPSASLDDRIALCRLSY